MSLIILERQDKGGKLTLLRNGMAAIAGYWASRILRGRMGDS